MAINAHPSVYSKPTVLGVLLLIGVLCAVCVSCAGGGGDDDLFLPSNLTYTGSQDQATITSGNAQQIAGTALAGGQLGSNFGNIASGMSIAAAADQREYTVYKTYQVMEDVLFQVELSSRTYGPTAIVSESDVIPGGLCGSEGGGNASYTIELNNITGAFSGSLKFNYYCVEGVEIYGNTTFTGTADLTDPNNPQIDRFKLDFGVLGIADYYMDEEGYIQGTFTYDGTSSPGVLTMDLIIQEYQGLTYKIEDYVWEVTYNDIDRTTTIEIKSGRFYHPSHGYVDISTGNPFVFWDGVLWPSDGDLLLLGQNSTAILLESLGPNECRITADTDGDGVHDYLPPEMLWNDLLI